MSNTPTPETDLFLKQHIDDPEIFEKLVEFAKNMESQRDYNLQERDELQRWKDEATVVMPDWQEWAKHIKPIRYGVSVPDQVIPHIQMLERQRDALLSALENLERRATFGTVTGGYLAEARQAIAAVKGEQG